MEQSELKRALKLCLVTDSRRSKLPLPEAVEKAVRGGVTSVQVREKDMQIEEVRGLIRQVREAIGDRHVLLVVNYFVDMAIELADGVHLGLGGPAIAEARRRGATLIGASAHSKAEALQAQKEGASYIFFGPVFETRSKPGAKAQGLEALRHVRRAVNIPLVGIGGITPGNAAAVMEAGADGVAVVSSILASDDPEGAAKDLIVAIEEAHGEKSPDNCRL